ncbi:MFS general substrate transporter [Pyrenochaeta sp. DS3sAY3a]|nr:MFS general substrate transporter [Pyrenochaeta sp. DS3sAY3a]
MTGLVEGERCPDGGSQAWLVVLGAWCAMIPSMGLLNTLAVLQAWISTHELPDISESKLGWIFSSYVFFLFFSGAQIGPIIDAYCMKLVLVPGSIAMISALVLLSFSKEYYQILLSFGCLGGIASAVLYNCSLTAISHWFKERRALAMGIGFTAGGLGGITFPLIILYVAPRLGFAWTIRIIALISAVCLVVACLLLRKRLPHNKAAKVSVDLKALLDIKFGMTTAAVFLVEFAVFIPYSYITSYALSVGFEPTQAYLLNVYLNAGAIPGRTLPGYIADRYGTFNTLCTTSLVCAILILTIWITADQHSSQIIAFTILFGFWSGAAISLTPVSIAQVSKLEELGKRNGTAYGIASIGCLIGIPIAGAILEAKGGGYRGLIILAGALYIAAFIAFVLARGIVGGWKITKV